MKTASDFGRYFRERREALGLSLSEFCRRNGLDKGNVSKIETGKSRPPRSAALLAAYAKALKFVVDSPDTEQFYALAEESLSIRSQKSSSKTKRTPSRSRTGLCHRNWCRAERLEQWAGSNGFETLLPQVVRRLIYATTPSITNLSMPDGTGTRRPDFDGIVETSVGSLKVPRGSSNWELSTEAKPQKKAEKEFEPRTRQAREKKLDPKSTTLVFLTPRKWTTKRDWEREKNELGVWRKILAYDSADLAEWLELAPAVDWWLARQIGASRDLGVLDIDEKWENLASLPTLSKPPLPPLAPNLFLTFRDDQRRTLEEWLSGDASTLKFYTNSPGEVADFVAAWFAEQSPADRDRFAARALVVETQAAWQELSATEGPLLLIAGPTLPLDAEQISQAVRHGHRVILPTDSRAGKSSELGRVPRWELEKSLVEAKFDREVANRLARESGGSLSVLRRRLAQDANPLPWSQGSAAGALLPILLCGRWDETCSADREILATVAGTTYETVAETCARWGNVADPPVLRIGNEWRLVSREESWQLLGRHLCSHHLERFADAAMTVLGSDDPRYELPPDERPYAGLQGKLLRHSEALRSGLAETVALLGAYAEVGQIPNVLRPGDQAEKIVAELLPDNADWIRWASLSSQLPLLAEAAPDVFLHRLERDVFATQRSEEPACEVANLFHQTGDPFFSSSPHTGLLWALETLAWDASLLLRVALVLARLDELDPGIRMKNRPRNSLAEIFLPWHPQTNASIEQRLRALESIVRKHPAAGWRLLLELVPGARFRADLTSRPSWRDWAIDVPKTTYADIGQQSQAVCRMLLENVGSDPDRWRAIFRTRSALSSDNQRGLIARLEQVDWTTVPLQVRCKLAIELHRQERRMRRISENDDSAELGESQPNTAAGIAEPLLRIVEGGDPVVRFAWLFADDSARMRDHETYDEYRQRQDGLCRDAVAEVFRQGGLSQIVELATSARQKSFYIGAQLAETGLIERDEELVPQHLDNENQVLRELANGFCFGLWRRRGEAWIASRELNRWTPDQAANLAACVLPFERATWELVERLGDEVGKRYWHRVRGHGLREASPSDQENGIRKLLEHRRPWRAIALLSNLLYGKREVSPMLIVEALEQGVLPATTDQSPGSDIDDTRPQLTDAIQQLIEHMQNDSSVDKARLMALEMEYFCEVVCHDGYPKTLVRELQRQPAWFADLLSMMFRPEKESDDVNQIWTEDDQQRAQFAHKLIHTWQETSELPGKQPDGTIDERALLDWVREARRLCETTGLLGVADEYIGELLAHHTGQPHGTVPPEAVRDVVETIASEDIDRGLYVGIINSRGAVMRNPVTGGDPERELAQLYRQFGDECQTDWPRCAAVLRKVANGYEHDAQREDAQAESQY